MADLVASLLTFPPEKSVSAKEYDKQAVEYVKGLGKVAESNWLKHVNKQNILELLNPAVNSLPYLFALTTQWNAAGKDRARHEDAVNRSIVFFSSFDAVQIRYAGEYFRSLLEFAIDVYYQLGILDYSPIWTAMLRLDPTAGTFTSNHLRLVRLCLRTGVPSQALPILDKNIYAFPQAPPKNLPDEPLCEDYELSSSFITTKSGFSVQLKSEYVLEYYLLGAHVYIGLRNYSRARLFLECVMLTPTIGGSSSTLQSEAYKKWILLGLLAQGKTYPIPRTHNQVVMKSLKAVGRSYEALADSFEKRNWRKYQAEMDAGAQIWHDDGNLRLVKEVGDALLRYRVIDLQKTYAALPVSRVAHHLGMPADATLRMLQEVLREGHINASITPASSGSAGDAVLHFHFTSTAHPDGDLEAQAKQIKELTSFIRDADRRLQLSKEYIEFTKRSKRGAAGPDGDLADQMDLSWDPPIGDMDEDGDEDIMGA
jgi:COP9 signalosome complex subunit 3